MGIIKNKISEKKSLLYGGFQGVILQTPIEFFDAYHKGWGFSVSDMIANALGSLFFIAQQQLFNNQIFKPVHSSLFDLCTVLSKVFSTTTSLNIFVKWSGLIVSKITLVLMLHAFFKKSKYK